MVVATLVVAAAVPELVWVAGVVPVALSGAVPDGDAVAEALPVGLCEPVATPL